MAERLPVLALTPGEPSGIGPDLAVIIAQEVRDYRLVLIADPQMLADRARSLRVPFSVCSDRALDQPGVCTVPIETAAPVEAGKLDPRNAEYVLKTLERAAVGCLAGEFDALVTGPVHKGVINDTGVGFTGHTEFLATIAKAPQVVMMLVADGLRVALATTHLPLAKVPTEITRPRLGTVIRILHRELIAKFGIVHPVIRVCGLNPHAGESGHLGREEIETITPVIEMLRAEGLRLLGPAPADTAFTPNALAQVDAVLAMYHDQGLPVLKHVGFGHAVNVTLGLPFIRTSVDHGTALDLAGSGGSDPGSLRAAIDLALGMIRARKASA